MVVDIDPNEGLDFGQVRQAAVDIRDILGAIGLLSWPLPSGGEGVHVVVPPDAWEGYLEVDQVLTEQLQDVVQR